ncbi:unnamed protein product, partial [Musa banksii]
MAVGWKKSTTWGGGDNCSLLLRNKSLLCHRLYENTPLYSTGHPHSSRLPLHAPPLGPDLPASPPARSAPSSLPFPVLHLTPLFPAARPSSSRWEQRASAEAAL